MLEKEEYIKVNLDTVNEVGLFDIFRKTGPSGYVLLKKAGVGSEDQLRKVIAEKGDILYVRKSDHSKYLEHLESNLKNILEHNKENPEVQSKIIQDVVGNVVEDLFNDPKSSNIEVARTLVNSSIEQIMEFNIAPMLVNMAVYDHKKYVHSINSFMLAVHFAKFLNCKPEEIKEIGLGAMLHDIGETMVDPEITKYEGRFNPEQRKKMQEHPMLGYRLLQDARNVSPNSYFMVAQHHERWDGSGYPYRQKEEQVSKYARILSIVDVYDAMTSKRPYRPAFGAFDALKEMALSRQFNKYELRNFIEFVGHTSATLKKETV